MNGRERAALLAERHALVLRAGELVRQICRSGGGPDLRGRLVRVNGEIREVEARLAADDRVGS